MTLSQSLRSAAKNPSSWDYLGFLEDAASQIDKLTEALKECMTDEGARAFTDESRSAASFCRRRLDAINATVQSVLAEPGASIFDEEPANAG